MSFVIDAIARGVSASRAASVRPSTELWTTYARACTGGAAASAGLETTTAASAATARMERITAPQGRRRTGCSSRRGRGRAGRRAEGRGRGPGFRRASASTVVPVRSAIASERVARAHDDRARATPGCTDARRARRRAGRSPAAPSGRAGRRPSPRAGRGPGPPRGRRGRDRASPAGRRPDRSGEPRRLGTRGRPPVVGRRVAIRVDDRPRGVDERARRPARECPRDVRGARALRPDAGQEDDRAGHLPPRLADDARRRGADDRADAREPARADELLAPARRRAPRRAARAAVRRSEPRPAARRRPRSRYGRGGRGPRPRGGRRRRTDRASRDRGRGSP